jgi:hypothetical protein
MWAVNRISELWRVHVTDRIVASLVYDTRSQPLSSGIRAVVQRARRLLYSADDTELVLQVAPGKQPDRLKLAGQVLEDGMPVEGAAVNLHGPASHAEETDEEGEFLITSLPKGAYSLDIKTPAKEMSIEAIDVE